MALPGPRSFPGSTMTDAHSQVTEIPPRRLALVDVGLDEHLL